MPYDHKNTTPDGLPLQRMKSLLEEVNRLHCQKRCVVGSGGGSVGLVDFLYESDEDWQKFYQAKCKYLSFFCHLSSVLSCHKHVWLVVEVVLLG